LDGFSLFFLASPKKENFDVIKNVIKDIFKGFKPIEIQGHA
jgi:hypothetical protein